MGETYPVIVPAPKPEKAPKAAATTENGEAAPKAKRGRKRKVVATEAAATTEAPAGTTIPFDGDVTDATATDDRVAA
jgi:hypothetical protein